MRRNIKTFKGNGFTLAEILVALFILSIALLALARMHIRSIEAGDYSGRVSIAISLAQDKIEEFRNTPYADIVDGSDTKKVYGAKGGTTLYTRTWTVSEGIWGPRTKEVVVTVTWGPLNRKVTLRSIVVGS